MSDKRCFLQWFVLCLSYTVVAFFAAYYGVFQQIWAVDLSRMTSVIAGVFVLACGYLGFASWRYDANLDREEKNNLAIADAELGRTAAYIVTLIGLLGTAIGLMFQVQAMAAIDLSNSGHILQFVATIGGALGTALYATACGIVASIGITMLGSNLEFFTRRENDKS